MHGYGTSKRASSEGTAAGVVAEVLNFVEERIESAVAAGLARERILVDPGFGFGKTIQQNLEIIRRLRELRVLGLPILIGPSRKGTIGHILGGLPVQERVAGTAAAAAVWMMRRAAVSPVHD